jgi:hypothetical protein
MPLDDLVLISFFFFSFFEKKEGEIIDETVGNIYIEKFSGYINFLV